MGDAKHNTARNPPGRSQIQVLGSTDDMADFTTALKSKVNHHQELT